MPVFGKRQPPVRMAVVGVGHIAQVAMLPAFEHADGCEACALVSDDAEKAREVAKKYGIDRIASYEEYDQLLASGEIDAVYIALPNNLHCDYAVRAARAGVHVLCEKPMAVTSDECRQMIAAANEGGVKLMIAYRLHFEKSNLRAIDVVQSGQLGNVRVFTSTFTLPVVEGNIRLKGELGGGTLYDIGIYCINAARYLFRDEPIEVVAASFNGGDPRFEGVDEATSVILRFPQDRVAAFTASFGVEDVGYYTIAGGQGSLTSDHGYNYVGDIRHWLTIDGKTSEKTFPSRDQFAPLLNELARCIREDQEPEPNGMEGLADVQIIQAAYRSAMERRPIPLEPVARHARPSMRQEERRPPIDKPELVDVQSASGDD
jgi:glucose-fructose oxidoreductase